ncbi:helix-turn-helix transcriptional regulator [Proteiniclasticum sp. BAD-10]|uniref:Helix-turn-helix transcriptional regulator n=1 Tax=Proteiniclasticum sediminis TaxID=2804028 RepID=A0A941CLX8_9CLOT|nr:helix-turn-helix transcriptional regulator [Proteiniclasticum sediminis]MBR0575086.1 helix-turn-helix transcriptional regulator [Proteiniclasticum sediminis]
MAKTSPYETGELTDSIFLILLATMEPIHGYKIMQKIQEMTQGAQNIGPATMYTTLRKLKEAAWIEEQAEEEAKIVYQLTLEGRRILEKNVVQRRQLLKLAETYMGGKR